MIDDLMEKHQEDQEKSKYILVCSIEDFKTLQRLMRDKYKIKDYAGTNSMWRHVLEEDNTTYREGTVKFKGFNLNVYCSPKIIGGAVVSKMNGLPLAYMDIFKNG